MSEPSATAAVPPDCLGLPHLVRTRSYTLGPESDVGNIEYKRHLLSRDNDRIDKLTTQLSFRLNEGNGRAQYRIGVEDGGSLSCLSLEDLESSVVMLNMMAESVSASLKNVERIEYKLAASTTAATTSEKDDSAAESSTTSYYYAIVNIEACYDDDTTKVDIRIAVCGNVDAGKSTCIGVMKTGMLDDGRGSARTTTMIHSHEIESGRTSTVSHHVIGFKNDGRITNYEQGSRQPSVDMITQQSVRLLTFIDLAGHEKYLRSMIYGVSSTLLDYSLVLINARSGVTHMTHHHLTVCCMMNIPIVILFTKVDSCPAHRYKQTVEETRDLLKAPDVRKRLMLINTQQAKGSDAENAAAGGGGSNNTAAAGTDSYGGRTSVAPTTTSTAAGAGANLKAPTDGKPDDETDSKTATAAALALHSVLTCLTATRQVGIPAFPVSFTEGTNLEFLRRLCRFLPKRRKHADKKSENLEYIVDRIYSVPGVGPVLYGFVNQGTVSANKAVWIGPFTTGTEGKGEFSRSNVKTIHYNCLPVKTVGAGNFCTLAVKLDKLQIRNIRRGMVLMETAPIATLRFRAKINIVFAQSTTIKVGYTPFLHILMVRQSAIVESVETISRGSSAGTTNDGEEKVNKDSTALVRPGDMSIITFRFAHRAEYIRENMRIMFRDGKVKGIGFITEILSDTPVDVAVEPTTFSTSLAASLSSPPRPSTLLRTKS